MTTQDWLTVLAIVLGPVTAVCITLWIERGRRDRDGRLRIVRMLLATRHLPAHPDYNVAINLTPLEFNNCEPVMNAWRRYHAVLRETPAAANQEDHDRRLRAAQSSLIFQAMVASGLKLSEGDIQSEVYLSQGFVDRELLYLKSLQAMPEIAAALKQQVANTQTMLEFMSRAQQSPPGRVE